MVRCKGVVTVGSATTTPLSRFFAEIATVPHNGASLEQKNDLDFHPKPIFVAMMLRGTEGGWVRERGDWWDGWGKRLQCGNAIEDN